MEPGDRNNGFELQKVIQNVFKASILKFYNYKNKAPIPNGNSTTGQAIKAKTIIKNIISKSSWKLESQSSDENIENSKCVSV